MTVLALNAQRKLNSLHAWVDALREAVDFHDFDLLYVPECDGTLSEQAGPLEIEGCAVHRWWPGVGCTPMALVIRGRMRPYIKRIDKHGRAVSVHFANSEGYDYMYVLMHGEALRGS